MVAAYEAGELVTTCAWCGRVTFDGEWVRVPHAALLAIDVPGVRREIRGASGPLAARARH
jgi:hypothetical protein